MLKNWKMKGRCGRGVFECWGWKKFAPSEEEGKKVVFEYFCKRIMTLIEIYASMGIVILKKKLSHPKKLYVEMLFRDRKGDRQDEGRWLFMLCRMERRKINIWTFILNLIISEVFILVHNFLVEEVT
jgi:hypothetical protein